MMVASAAPVGLPSALPAVALACVFFWSLFRPAAMSPPVCFAIGLLQDLLGFAPLGIGILTMLVVHGLALRLRRRWRGSPS
ncbi:rod shape-determining protein MreD [Pseudoroseomonas wenyumeiae]